MTEKNYVEVDHPVQEREVFVSEESWMKRNAIPIFTAIISLGIILGTFLITYGRVTSEVANYEKELASFHADLVRQDLRIAEVNAKVDAHHQDFARHLDPDKWNLIMSQLQELRTLVLQHMQTSRSVQTLPGNNR